MQDGTLHISVDTYAHVVVDKIYQTVFLDVWDEDKKDWVKVNHWDFVKSIEEEPRLSSSHTSKNTVWYILSTTTCAYVSTEICNVPSCIYGSIPEEKFKEILKYLYFS